MLSALEIPVVSKNPVVDNAIVVPMIANAQGKAYEITALGWILYDVLQTAETAKSFLWELKIIDAIDGTIPIKEKHEIIKKLIPDESIQKILQAKR